MNEQESGLATVGRKYFADLQEKMRAILEDVKELLASAAAGVKVVMQMECIEGTLEYSWPIPGHMRYYMAVAAGRCRQRRCKERRRRQREKRAARKSAERMKERTSREWKL